MKRYRVLRPHLCLGNRALDVGDVIAESEIGAETAAQFVATKRLAVVEETPVAPGSKESQ